MKIIKKYFKIFNIYFFDSYFKFVKFYKKDELKKNKIF